MSINLLPAELKSGYERRTGISLFLIAGLLYCLFFLVTNGFLFMKIHYLEQEQREWERIQMEAEGTQRELEAIENELVTALAERDILKALAPIKKQQQTTILYAIQQHLPQSLRIQKLLITEDGLGELTGGANSMDEIGYLLDVLNNHELFAAAHLTGLEFEKELGLNLFRIEVIVRN